LVHDTCKSKNSIISINNHVIFVRKILIFNSSTSNILVLHIISGKNPNLNLTNQKQYYKYTKNIKINCKLIINKTTQHKTQLQNNKTKYRMSYNGWAGFVNSTTVEA